MTGLSISFSNVLLVIYCYQLFILLGNAFHHPYHKQAPGIVLTGYLFCFFVVNTLLYGIQIKAGLYGTSVILLVLVQC